MAASKFAEVLAAKKIDPRRLVAASRKLERLVREDRAIKLAKRQARASEGEAPKDTRKPKSGRPITQRTLDAAMIGGPLSGPIKTRLLRAINHLLEQKKTEALQLKALF